MSTTLERDLFLDTFKCPRCGAAMESGYLLGSVHGFKWGAQPSLSVRFHGVPLRPAPSLGARIRATFWPSNQPRHLQAKRCPLCLLGLFSYDRYIPDYPDRAALLFAGFMALFMVPFAALFLRLSFLASRAPKKDPDFLALFYTPAVAFVLLAVWLAVVWLRLFWLHRWNSAA